MRHTSLSGWISFIFLGPVVNLDDPMPISSMLFFLYLILFYLILKKYQNKLCFNYISYQNNKKYFILDL